jgi:fumarate hydratase class II
MKLMEIMYREDIHQANELQNISDAINDITDNADHIALRNEFSGYLTMILQELANCLDQNTFRLKNLNLDQKENF